MHACDSSDRRPGAWAVKALLSVAAALAPWPYGALAQPAADPIFGTWTLDIQKSRFLGPPPKSNTLTIEPTTTGYRLTQQTELPDGRRIKHVSTCNFHGQSCSVEGGDSFSTLRVSAYVIRGKMLHASKIVEYQTSRISPDRHTMTVTTEIPANAGSKQSSRTVMVFHRK